MALAWSFVLLGFATVTGFAALTAIIPREPVFRRLFWSPAFGFGVMTLALFFLSRAGIPVERLVVPLVASVLVSAVLIVVWRRPRVSARRLLSLFAVIVVVYAANAVPLTRLGSAWLGYVNGDMLFYCVGAENLVRHGTGDLPSGAELDARTDIARTSAGFYAYGGVREGSELLLAFAAALENVHADQAFMGLQIALIAALAAAGGAIVARSARRRFAATVAGAAAGAIPLVAYSAFNGLMPQLAGCALLAVAFALCGDRAFAARDAKGIGLAGGIAAAAMLVLYPEIFPFFLVPVLARAVLARRIPRAHAVAVVVTALILNLYLPVALGYSFGALAARGGVALTANAAGAPIRFGFPYLLQPIGQANLWGFAALAASPADPRTQAGIVVGLLASVVTIVFLIRRRREPIAAVVGVMFTVLVVLVLRRSDFGSFKAALYMEPFLALFWATVGRNGVIAAAWVLLALPVQQYYVERSYGELERLGNHYVTVPGASSRHLADRLEREIHTAPAALLTSDNGAVRELGVLRGRGIPTFEAQGRALPLWGVPPRDHVRTVVDGRPVTAASYVRDVVVPRIDRGGSVTVPVGDRIAAFSGVPEVRLAQRFQGLRTIGDERDVSILNRENDDAMRSNVLVDIGSSLGRYGDHGLYETEADPYRRAQTMSAASRYNVFAVLAPTLRVRLRFDLVSAFVGDGTAALPPARIVTDRGITNLGIVGAGSARIVSEPIRLLRRNGRAYLVLDLGADAPKTIAEPRRGLWLLWGGDIQYDARDVVAYIRNLSVVPEGSATVAPTAIGRFPEDLANPALVFSGIYDDAWIAERSYAVLRRSSASKVLHVKFFVPGRASNPTRCTVLIDGRTLMAFDVAPGTVDETMGVSAVRPGPHRIELRFDRATPIGALDKRRASAVLQSLSFEAV